ncbi:hypothetical protein ACQPUY_02035 [Clostridium nigeriense]|uniref:hypothetical protein n=1 Tax=Clostridium nigeriense TaxID=1805470 RepID=UPI003D350A79
MILKKVLKVFAAIIIGIILGNSIGSINRVDYSLSTEINSKIEENKKIIESKQDELENLNSKKIQLESYLNN